MISALVAAAALGAAILEPLDLRLGWQVGDKLTYTVLLRHTGAMARAVGAVVGIEDLSVDDSGPTTLTIVKADDKTVTVSASGTVFPKEVLDPLPPSTHQMSRHGRVLTNFDPKSIAGHLWAMVLPEKPVEVGEEFTVKLASPEGTVTMTGKVARLEGKENCLAVLEMDGAMNPGVAASIRSTFHLKRRIFMKTSIRVYDKATGGENFSTEFAMTLKEQAGDRRTR